MSSIKAAGVKIIGGPSVIVKRCVRHRRFQIIFFSEYKQLVSITQKCFATHKDLY